MQFVLVSGLSGAGKNTVLQALDDVGFWVADNLPPQLWLDMYREAHARGVSRLAISTDARSHLFLNGLDRDLEALLGAVDVQILFLEASDDVLLQRYNLSRRTHPLRTTSLLVDFDRERILLAPLREKADWVVDTTHLDPKMLVSRVVENLTLNHLFSLNLVSFGFKYVPPRDSDLVLDVRGFPNPYYVDTLKHQTGQSLDVASYVFTHQTEELYQMVRRYAETSARLAHQSGRKNYSIAVGCTGGRHRSVAIVERLAREWADFGTCVIQHRDMDKVQ